MKVLFLIIILIHAIIHILAFLKAFDLAELKEFSTPVSKPLGITWLIALVLLTISAVLFIMNQPFWWIWGILGSVISQILIIQFWQEAKFGTIPNMIIMLVSIAAYSQFNFEKMVKKEINFIQKESITNGNKIITHEMIVDLPIPVRNWLENSGIVGKPAIGIVQMEQTFEIKLKPDQDDWIHADAEQFISSYPPAFVWKAHMKILRFFSVIGRDKFIGGEGEILFKLFSISPVAKDGYNPQINEAALQRFIGEIIWIPSAALEEYVTWEGIDELSAKISVTNNGTTGSGVFTFNKNGDFEKFSTMRYMGSGSEAEKIEWVVKSLETKEVNGIKIPTRCTATWRLESGDWTWAQIEVKNYNMLPMI